MLVLYLILFFIVGAVLGSFYCVVGLRLPEKKSFVKGRSKCDSCNHELKYYELIPILSYLVQKGRCRHCHKKIPVLFTYIELFSGVLFAVSYYSFGFSYDLLLALGIVSLFMIVIVSDLTYYIISDEVLIFFSIYFILVQLFHVGVIEAGIHVLSGAFLFSVMYIIMLIGNYIFKKESLGGGDIKMMFLFGLILDPLLGTMTIFLGSLLALPVAFGLMLSKKDKVIPFGPFLLAGFLLLFFSKVTTSGILEYFTI